MFFLRYACGGSEQYEGHGLAEHLLEILFLDRTTESAWHNGSRVWEECGEGGSARGDKYDKGEGEARVWERKGEGSS